MQCLQASAWFEYLGFVQTDCPPVRFCTSILLGDIVSANSQDAAQQENLHARWADQGQAWQQCPPPKTPPSPTPASAAQHRRAPKHTSGPVLLGDGEGMCAAPISSHWGSQKSPASPQGSPPAHDPHNNPCNPPVPVMQLPTRSPSGNPFASVHASLDGGQSATGSGAPAAAAAAGSAPPQAAAGAVVPPLALHRLPAPFGNALGHNSQLGQSRLGLESGMVVASSFTSTSLSFSEVTSTGYTTRAPSPDVGLKSHFLHAAMSQHEEYTDDTLAVSNPLFGCSPKRGNSPGRCSSCQHLYVVAASFAVLLCQLQHTSCTLPLLPAVSQSSYQVQHLCCYLLVITCLPDHSSGLS